jgi:Zn-dependent M16 (insulinase) family peptidase
LREETSAQLKEEGWNKGESTPKLDFSDDERKKKSEMLTFAEKRDQFVQELPSLFERGVWWCSCESGQEEKIIEALKISELLPKFSSSSSVSNNQEDKTLSSFFKTRGFDLEITFKNNNTASSSSSSSSSSIPETKIIEFPTDTSFAAIARANDSIANPLHPSSTSVSLAAQIVKAEYFHREIREKGGAYGSFASFSSEDGTTTHVSYRDPQPKRSLEEVFKNSGKWLSSSTAEEGHVNENMVEQALLRVFAGLDAPRTPASFGDRLFFHSISEEMRQQRRDRYLETTLEQVRDEASKYFGCDQQNESENVSCVIVQPENKK